MEECTMNAKICVEVKKPISGNTTIRELNELMSDGGLEISTRRLVVYGEGKKGIKYFVDFVGTPSE